MAPVSDEVSWFAKTGDSSICRSMPGTPVKFVIFSRSTRAGARSGSQRCIRISVVPPKIAGARIEWQPVT